MIRRTPLLILFMLAACAEEAAEPAGPPPNRAPETILALPDRELAEGMAMRINFEEHFRDPDGDTLLFVARSSDPTVAAIAVEGAVLRVHARVPGQAEVSVVVRDPRELEVQDAFAVSVSASLDREVLVAFYEATDGPNWKDNTNWLTDAPLGEWYGVSVNGEGRVVGLELRGNALAGELPAELGKLTALTYLYLADNTLTGSLPPELGKLAGLVTLDMGANGLTGELPPELGDLERLTWLGLRGNALTGKIPSELGKLATLRVLSLYGNRLTGGIPPELGGLTALEWLFLNNNNLTGAIPESLLNLGALEVLNLANTTLCIPGTGEFWQWQKDLDFNGVYCNVVDREILNTLHRALTGADWTNSDGWLNESPVLSGWHGVTTDSLGQVTGIKLPANNLQGYFPGNIVELAELKLLDISDNPDIQGRLPADLTDISLKTFRFAGTGLCSPEELLEWLATIPMTEGTNETCPPLTDREILTVLYQATDGPNWTISENWLTDAPLGEWYGVGVNEEEQVVRLVLRNNKLKGRIPAELGSLAALIHLHLADNTLAGSLPPELGSLFRLEYLDMGANGLTGQLPPELGDLERLTWLGLRGNALTGKIPPELGKLAMLRGLSLYDNRLTGEIPLALGNLSNLIALYLSDNELSGAIPPGMGQLSGLQNLSLGNNRLTGSIPLEFGNLSVLRDLRLSDNELSGAIPSELGNLGSLQRLYLDNNQLTGGIPSQLGNLGSLKRLRLDGNELTGGIPPQLGNLTTLEWLDLYNNEGFSGALPITLTALDNLSSLVTSNTGLCAPVDPAFSRWTKTLLRYRVRQCSTGMAYLVQSSQNLDHPVPLIAGREALLRVFPTAPAGSRVQVPPVRASFYDSGSATAFHTVEIPGKPGPLPTELDESDLAISANVRIPGELLQPGLEMVIEIDPEGTLDPALGIVRRIPTEGRMALEIEDLPMVEFTLVPFLWTEDPDSSILATISEMVADPEGHNLMRYPRSLIPTHEWSVMAHDPVWIDFRPDFGNGIAILNRTQAIRTMEGGRGYWMGTLVGGGGWAYRPGYVQASGLDSRVIAHEMGHNLSLWHAPCGNIGGIDYGYPYPHGNSGVWGFDFATDELVSPSTADMMGNCRDSRVISISDYHFTNAFRHRLHTEPPAPAPAPTLLLWGGVDSTGTPHLEPAFVVDAPPTLPEAGGPWTIEGTTATGQTLFTLPFAMPEIADGGGGEGGFVWQLPIRPAGRAWPASP